MNFELNVKFLYVKILKTYLITAQWVMDLIRQSNCRLCPITIIDSSVRSDWIADSIRVKGKQFNRVSLSFECSTIAKAACLNRLLTSDLITSRFSATFVKFFERIFISLWTEARNSE